MSSHIAQLLVTLFVVVFSISSTVRTFLLMFLPVVIVTIWLCCRKRGGATRASRRKRGEEQPPYEEPWKTMGKKESVTGHCAKCDDTITCMVVSKTAQQTCVFFCDQGHHLPYGVLNQWKRGVA